MKPESIGFFATLAAAFFLGYLPGLHIPFDWMATFFHEISHGLTAVLTGGRAMNIRLYLNGSGECITTGGWRPLVLLAGYSGAAAAGAALYLTADRLPPKRSDEIAWGLLIFLAVSAALLCRDLITFCIMLGVAGLLFAVIRVRANNAVRIILKISGIYVLLDAIKAPLVLIDGRHVGDGARLADITHIPEVFWVMAWFGFGCYALWHIGKTS